MSAQEVLESAGNTINWVDGPQGLSAIRDVDCPAAIWRRRLDAGFRSWIDHLAPDQLPKARVILRPADVRDAVSQICQLAKTPDDPERDALIADVTALSDTLIGLAKAPFLRLRFDVVRTNACRKFHVDAVAMRLICTYRGTGTEYGLCPDGAEPTQVHTVPTGSPILLRGTLWPTQPVSSFRHRSPPIAGTGEVRLVLVLDPISDAEEAFRDGEPAGSGYPAGA